MVYRLVLYHSIPTDVQPCRGLDKFDGQQIARERGLQVNRARVRLRALIDRVCACVN
jgi:hypothetical protein